MSDRLAISIFANIASFIIDEFKQVFVIFLKQAINCRSKSLC